MIIEFLQILILDLGRAILVEELRAGLRGVSRGLSRRSQIAGCSRRIAQLQVRLRLRRRTTHDTQRLIRTEENRHWMIE